LKSVGPIEESPNAELEAGMISAHTKSALAAAKKRGNKLDGRRRDQIASFLTRNVGSQPAVLL
jgi:hypothetical protein